MTAIAPMMRDSSKIGGSDMASLLGLDSRRTALDLYLQLIGESAGFEGNEATELGQLFEGPLADWYAESRGVEIEHNPPTLSHPDYPWAQGHVDARVLGSSPRRFVEVKCSGADGWGEEGTDEIPESFLAQVHMYLWLDEAEICDVVACLWSGYGPPSRRIYTVERNEGWIEAIKEAGDEMWRRVQEKDPPDPTTSAQANLRWRKSTKGEAVEGDLQTVELLSVLSRAKAEEKQCATTICWAERHLKTKAGTAEAITIDGEPVWTWKTTAAGNRTSRITKQGKELLANHQEKS